MNTDIVNKEILSPKNSNLTIVKCYFPEKVVIFSKKVVIFQKSQYFHQKSSGISRNRSGTVSRVPGRSTCTYHTRDELRSSYDGRVMII